MLNEIALNNLIKDLKGQDINLDADRLEYGNNVVTGTICADYDDPNGEFAQVVCVLAVTCKYYENSYGDDYWFNDYEITDYELVDVEFDSDVTEEFANELTTALFNANI